ncbi:coth-domain-containing protein [Piromyces finnis]|uniref:Coth-domain-containing protein n=1 Tax=Piromyces finnis TaxID=1754191 RepID=A0A1Y1V5A1_9FUNG|nr:coth-domain-containing protein [Piromyces finnis]|eukprot:ORX47611.1 coth-domain-containing protein [Piromyces finnis]
MKFSNILSSLSLFALSASAAFWDNIERTELFEIMETRVPEMRVTLGNDTWNEMVEKAQVNDLSKSSPFETQAQMKFIYDGVEEEYIINFKLGGRYSRETIKPGYNIKIKGSGETLHGTKNFRLRGDNRDASLMREKITTEILQKSGLLAVEVGYTELYVNDQYMGIYVVSDAVKGKWIRRKFGDEREDIKTLYQCKEDGSRLDDPTTKDKCVNANEDFLDYMEPFHKFIDQVQAAKTRSDLEKIMDVDNFLKYMAFEWIVGTWDHYLGNFCHNFYWYQQPNGIWVYIPYDHDVDMGSDIWTAFFPDKPFSSIDEIEFANVSFKDFELNHPILKILVHDDDTVFRQLVGDIVSKVFNPDTLLTRINTVRSLIDPYVKKDKELNAGMINKLGKNSRYNYEHFYLNSEYTYIFNDDYGFKGYGLKDWIVRHYNFIANYYGIDKNHKLIEPRPEPVVLPYTFTYERVLIGEKVREVVRGQQYAIQQYSPNPSYADDSAPVLGVNKFIKEQKDKKPQQIEQTEQCWSKKLNYPCCKCTTYPIYKDNDGAWGIENNSWCGIPNNCPKSECPGKIYGYNCCDNCNVISTDQIGNWGISNGQWCSIKESC